MKNVLLTALSVVTILATGMTAYAAEKEIPADINKDYTAAKFILTFDEAGDYDVTITDPSGSSSYTATKTDNGEYTCIVQDVSMGTWNIHVTDNRSRGRYRGELW